MPTGERTGNTAVSGREQRGTPSWSLTLLGNWRLSSNRTKLRIHHREQRLIALLALQGERPRSYVAGVLWPESSERHAAGNLRAAVWRVDRDAPGLLTHDRTHVGLRPPLHVDVDELDRWSRRIVAARVAGPKLDHASCLRALPVLVRGELLPGWYDDWVGLERTRLTQLRLHALEALAAQLLAHRSPRAALVAASAAVAIEPLHEPATRALIRAEIEDGNVGGALRAYEVYRSRVLAELGVGPSQRLGDLVRPLLDLRLATAGA